MGAIKCANCGAVGDSRGARLHCTKCYEILVQTIAEIRAAIEDVLAEDFLVGELGWGEEERDLNHCHNIERLIMLTGARRTCFGCGQLIDYEGVCTCFGEPLEYEE